MFRKSAPLRLVGLVLLALLLPKSMNASPLYKPAQTYSLSQGNLSSLVTADLNGDGKLDLLATVRGNGFPGAVQVLLGNGNGTFQIAGNYPVGSDANWIAIADVNGDGKPDALVATFDGASVLLGNGDGSFQESQNYPIRSHSGTLSIAIGDVNRDAKLDLVLGLICIPSDPCKGAGGSTVLFGNGDGSFVPTGTYFFSGGTSLALADLNHDGKLDLVSDSQENHANTVVQLGNGDGTFQEAHFYDGGGFNGGTIAVADLNADDNPDVITANNCQNSDCRGSTIGVLLGLGDGTLRKVQIYGHPGGYIPNQVAVDDVNGDGLPDLVVANNCNNSDTCDTAEVGLLIGRGDGTFSRFQHYSSGASTGLIAASVAVGDVNGDATPDIFVLNGDGVGVLLSLSATSTKLASKPNPSVQGQAVTLIATVSSASQIAPGGRVVFRNGSTSIGAASIVGGKAKLIKGNLPVGRFSLTATYQGDANSLKSTSPVRIQVVNATSAHR